jgi:hypothetical protein
MGSLDESSSDMEQGEKILFFYPLDTPLYQQVLESQSHSKVLRLF